MQEITSQRYYVKNLIDLFKLRFHIVPYLCFKPKLLLLLVITSFSTYTQTFSEHPIWFQDVLNEADKLNNKNPVLALEFTQKILTQHKNLPSIAKAAIFVRLAKYQHILCINNRFN